MRKPAAGAAASPWDAGAPWETSCRMSDETSWPPWTPDLEQEEIPNPETTDRSPALLDGAATELGLDAMAPARGGGRDGDEMRWVAADAGVADDREGVDAGVRVTHGGHDRGRGELRCYVSLG